MCFPQVVASRDMGCTLCGYAFISFKLATAGTKEQDEGGQHTRGLSAYITGCCARTYKTTGR